MRKAIKESVQKQNSCCKKRMRSKVRSRLGSRRVEERGEEREGRGEGDGGEIERRERISFVASFDASWEGLVPFSFA